MKINFLENKSGSIQLLFAFFLASFSFAIGLLFFVPLNFALSNWSFHASNHWELVSGSIITFFVLTSTAFIFSNLIGKEPKIFLKTKLPAWHATIFLVTYTISLVLASAPLINFLDFLNENIPFPAALQALEQSLRATQAANKLFFDTILIMPRPFNLGLNLFFVALLPAIGEELFFRGIVQQLFQKISRNAGLGILLTAIIFSAAHQEFFGFLPRLALGLLLGYLFFQGKSIWFCILAHFLNNGIIVSLAYLYQHEYISTDLLANTKSFELSDYLFTLISLLLSGILVLLFRKKSTLSKKNPVKMPVS